MRRYKIIVAATLLLLQGIAAKHNHDSTMITSKGLIAPKLSEHKPTEREVRNFWKKVDKNGPLPDQSVPHYKGLDQCWIWTGASCRGGYGTVWVANQVRAVHRVAFLIQHGYLAEELEVIHLCDNRRCIHHLKQGTTRENIRDCINKGRHVAPKGEDQGLAKLTEEKVREIRRRYASKELGQVDLAKEYGMGQSAISALLRRKTWKHVI